MDVLKCLGLKIDLKENISIDNLNPNYTITKANIHNIECLMIKPLSKVKSIKEVEKIIHRLQKELKLPIFLHLNEISNFKRDHLIENNIPFIFQNKLVYLPFMATILTNEQLNQRRISETFTASSQLLLLWMLYQEGDHYYLNNAAKSLSFSNMTITRAYRQLIATGYLKEHKDGRKIYLSSEYSKKELFVKMKPYFRNPILKTVYIEEKDLNNNMHLSGLSLLNKLANLNIDSMKTYAILESKLKDIKYQEDFEGLNKPIKLDIWEYDPIILAKYSDIIDPLSLIITLIDSSDKEVKKALDAILNMM